MLEDQGCLMFQCEQDTEGKAIPCTTSAKFYRQSVNCVLDEWIQYKLGQTARAALLDNYSDEEQERMQVSELSLEEAEKQRLMSSQVPIKKEQ